MKAKTRCHWAGTDPLYVAYHDEEWGVPLHDDRRLFEMLVLEGAQAGLSWITILRKRERYRRVFGGFDPRKVARYDKKKIEALLARSGDRAEPGEGGRRRQERPRLPRGGPRARELRPIHLGLRRRQAHPEPKEGDGRRAGGDRGVAGHEQGPAPARLHLRRARRSATRSCRRRGWSTTTWRRASGTGRFEARQVGEQGAGGERAPEEVVQDLLRRALEAEAVEALREPRVPARVGLGEGARAGRGLERGRRPRSRHPRRSSSCSPGASTSWPRIAHQDSSGCGTIPR